MPWIEALTDVNDLRRCIRDLVAISTLPAIWKDDDPYQIADGVAAALRSMLDLELVHISMRKGVDDPPIEITHTSNPQNYSALAEIRAALSSGNAAEQIKNCGLGDGQANHGQLRIASIPIGLGGDAIIIAASRQPDFPTELQRVLIGVGANEAAIALQRWRAETSHRRFSSLAETSADFVGYASLDGRPQYINPAGCELVGLSGLEEACRYHIFDYLMPNERERARCEIAPQVIDEGRWRGELAFRHFKTGRPIPFFVDWFRIDDSRTGRPMNIATVSRDMRTVKLAEAELRKLNESLEVRVLQRTAALADAHSKLVKEISERERADARLQELQYELYHAARLSAAGQMAAALAHELNQPLAAAANYVNSARRLLSNDASSISRDAAREALEEASGEIVRTGQIIRQLREFIARGTTERQLESVTELVENASALALTEVKSLGVKLTFEFGAKSSMAHADRIQIQQVLTNLMRNALEAMTGCERRELTITTAMRDKDTVEVSVADTGPGLTPDVASRLFEPFVSTKREGMGIGLSICRSIIEAHGGTLVSEPKTDGGMIFRFTLPAASHGEANAA